MTTKIKCTDANLKRIIRERYEKNDRVIDVRDLDTSECTTFHDLFSGLAKLRKIIGINKLDTRNIRSMKSMFAHSNSLYEVDFSGMDLPNLNDMSCLFDTCTGLHRVNMTNMNTHNNSINASYMFNCCRALHSLNTIGTKIEVYSLTSMFSCCSSLESVDISFLNFSPELSGFSFGCIFSYCYSLTEIDLSSMDLSALTDTTDMIKGCCSLTKIIPPKTFPKDILARHVIEENMLYFRQLEEMLKQYDNVVDDKTVDNINSTSSGSDNVQSSSILESLSIRKLEIERRQEQLNDDRRKLQEDITQEILKQQEKLDMLSGLQNSF